MLNNIGLPGLMLVLIFLGLPVLLAFFGHRKQIGTKKSFYTALFGVIGANVLSSIAFSESSEGALVFGLILSIASVFGILAAWFFAGGIARRNGREWNHVLWMFIPLVGFFYPYIAERNEPSDEVVPPVNNMKPGRALEFRELAKKDPAYKYISH